MRKLKQQKNQIQGYIPKKIQMVPVFETEESEMVIGYVPYNEDLDSNSNICGSIIHHKGLDTLKGKFVLIYGFQWESEKEYGVIISPERAVQEIIQSGNWELLNQRTFSVLRKIYERSKR